MAKIGYVFARGAFAALKDKMDPRKVNGGVFLGLEGIVIKSHGGTDAEGFASATELGYEMAREDLMAKVREMVAASVLHEAAAPDAAAAQQIARAE
jgi:glycerol-3-phosphate acyltransferase PlsX